jgi:hypothetical protein
MGTLIHHQDGPVQPQVPAVPALGDHPNHHWVGKLLGLDFVIEYKVGNTNTMANALSHHDTEEAVLHATSSLRFYFIDHLLHANITDPALVALKNGLDANQRAEPWSSSTTWWRSRAASISHLLHRSSTRYSLRCTMMTARAFSAPYTACAATSTRRTCAQWFKTTSERARHASATSQSIFTWPACSCTWVGLVRHQA